MPIALHLIVNKVDTEPRLLYVVTDSVSAVLLRGHLAAQRRAGFQVGFVASPGPRQDLIDEDVETFSLPMVREISPFADLGSLFQLVKLMRRWRPDVVNAGTPKAGLLGMLAARLTGVPVRVYHLRGLRLETTTGIKRWVLGTAERVASACAHEVIAVSQSLADTYVNLGLACPSKVRVVGAGSSNGVEVERFAAPDPLVVSALRARYGLSVGSPVIGFVGRLTRDKGVPELVDAFGRVRGVVPGLRLLLVGGFEDGDPVPEAVMDQIRMDPAIVCTGFVGDTAPYYALMDLLAFPSHREGFGNALLEASAAGVPVAGFRATGTVDAVVDGLTGTLANVGDVAGLAHAIALYLTDEGVRHAHGRAGQARARDEFQPERIWQALSDEYKRLLAAANIPSETAPNAGS